MPRIPDKSKPNESRLESRITSGKGVGSNYPLPERIKRLEAILERIRPIPATWLEGVKLPGEGNSTSNDKNEIQPTQCQEYKTVLLAWKKAMRWRQVMDDVLSTMLAVAISTMQSGDQLFLQVIGDAGGGKTRFCDAMLVSKYCYALEHLTGFHSGFKDAEGNCYSLLDRINNKTLITPEGDVIMSSPHFGEIMSQGRRIFDGTSKAVYKNSLEDQSFSGLRTPWIMAGTQALLETDQSRLGDRFLKVFIDSPDHNEKKDILRRVGFSALRSVMVTVTEQAEGQIDPLMVSAYKLTGGYVDYLRTNVSTLLAQLVFDEDELVSYCAMLGEFAADMRARPDPDIKKDSTPTKELPTRLTSQFIRLACCIGAVLNRNTIDGDILRRVRKVALDTSRGISIEIVNSIYSTGEYGAETKGIAMDINRNEDKTRAMLRFLHAIEVAETFRPENERVKSKPRWRLTQRFSELYERVIDE